MCMFMCFKSTEPAYVADCGLWDEIMTKWWQIYPDRGLPLSFFPSFYIESYRF